MSYRVILIYGYTAIMVELLNYYEDEVFCSVPQ